MERDEAKVAAEIADQALGVWEVSRNLLITSKPDRTLLANQLRERAESISKLAAELVESHS